MQKTHGKGQRNRKRSGDEREKRVQEIYPRAVKTVRKHGKASRRLLAEQLHVGSRIVKSLLARMVREKIITPTKKCAKHQVLETRPRQGKSPVRRERVRVRSKLTIQERMQTLCEILEILPYMQSIERMSRVVLGDKTR